MAQVALIGFEVALGLAGVGMMIPGLLPEKKSSSATTTVVKIGAGMHGLADEQKKTSTGGDFPDIMLYDESGRYIGRNKGGKEDHPAIASGGYDEVTITHNKDRNGLAATYLGIAASGNDAICINYVTVIQATGGTFGFLGDVGKACGASWYYSDTNVMNTDSNTSESPVNLNRTTSSCFWIDADKADGTGTNGIQHQGFGIHIIDFSSSTDIKKDGRAKQYSDRKETMCSSAPRFKMYEQMSTNTWIPIFNPPLKYNDNNTDVDLKLVINNPGIDISRNQRRANRRNLDQLTKYAKERRAADTTFDAVPFMAGTLIKSPLEEHSAKELCESGTSKGPDFVSESEGIFCDMDKKHTWPLCSDSVQVACFDVAQNKMRPAAKGRRWIDGRQIPEKSYDKEVKWGNNK